MINNKSNKSLASMLVLSVVCLSILLSINIVSAQLTVNLGTAGDFVILSKTGISTTGTTSITGDIGVSPIDHTAITGFSLIGDETTDTFLTSSLVTGKIYAANLVAPTPSNIGTSVSNMETAFTDAQGRTHTTIVTDLGAGDISGMTLTPGVSDGLYKWNTGLLINSGSPTGDPNGVTLDCQGDASKVFIFQIAQDLTVGNGAQITLIGNCQADNIFWAVDGGVGVSLGTTSQFEGNILASKAINLNTGATVNGRLLAQTAVTLDANSIILPNSTTPVLTTVVMSTNSTTLLVGSTQQLNASGFDQFGTSMNAIFNYNTSDAAIATVNSSGFVTAIAVGTAVITASNGTVNGTTNITVSASLPPPSSSSSSGSGGGSSGICTSKWTCTSWSQCDSNSNTQTRKCSYPTNWCLPKESKPIQSQSCVTAGTDTDVNTTPIETGVSQITGAVTGMSGKTIGILVASILAVGLITTLVVLQLRK